MTSPKSLLCTRDFNHSEGVGKARVIDRTALGSRFTEPQFSTEAGKVLPLEMVSVAASL